MTCSNRAGPGQRTYVTLTAVERVGTELFTVGGNEPHHARRLGDVPTSLRLSRLVDRVATGHRLESLWGGDHFSLRGTLPRDHTSRSRK